MSHIPENQLIEYAKKYLKDRGFKKKNKRWTKVGDEFTIVFFIQGSCYDKDNYYIRPGIYINELDSSNDYYGHFLTELPQDSPENIFIEFERFVSIWTDKRKIKETLVEFIKWEHRNPLEKRRAGLVDYEKDPVPSRVCFSIPIIAKSYILENY